MIGLDTNIPIRFFTQDDPAQSAHASRIIDRLTEEKPGFVSLVALVEIVWVLDRVYGLENRDIAAAIEKILQADTFVVQNEQEVFTSMVALKTGMGSFSDALIGTLGEWAGYTATLTFDKKATRLPGFAQA